MHMMNVCPIGCDITLSVQLPTRHISMETSPFGFLIWEPPRYSARITVQVPAPARSIDPKGCERDTLATDLTSQRKRDEPPPLRRRRYLDRRDPTAVPAGRIASYILSKTIFQWFSENIFSIHGSIISFRVLDSSQPLSIQHSVPNSIVPHFSSHISIILHIPLNHPQYTRDLILRFLIFHKNHQLKPLHYISCSHTQNQAQKSLNGVIEAYNLVGKVK